MNLKSINLLLFLIIPFLSFGQSKVEVGQQFLTDNYSKLELTKSDISEFIITDKYTSSHNGVTHIYYTQSYNGIKIHNAIFNVNISKDDRVLFHGNRFVKDIVSKIEYTQAEITPSASVIATAKKAFITNPEAPTLLREGNQTPNKYVFAETNYSKEKITAELKYYLIDDQLKLVWDVFMSERHNTADWSTKVDAITGEILKHENIIIACNIPVGAFHNHTKECRTHNHEVKTSTASEASAAMLVDGSSYRVYALPAESPGHGPHEILNEPANPLASPYGWHDLDGAPGPEFTYTRGNNVHAYQNADASGASAGDEPEGGMDLAFDYPHDTSLEPMENVKADVVNLFYMNNMMHDLTYMIGFDEAAGNFQNNTYGNGGIGGDHVIAGALDGNGTNNATFGPRVDGQSGIMSMFAWDVSLNSLFNISEPADIGGKYDTNTAGDGWGFDNTYADVDITGPLVAALDGDVSNPQNVCGAPVNDVTGAIALIQRGLCQFGEKAFNVQEAGAVAAIICNVPGADGAGSDGEAPMGMLGGDVGQMVTIPTISLGYSDCLRIIAALGAGVEVEGTIKQTVTVGPAQLSSGFDNGIIAHEYGHGISNRLVGGASTLGCVSNDEQMGEGISDWFSLIMTVEEGDLGTDSRGIGTYVQLEGTDGRGIRRFPYSTNPDVNAQTYDDIKGTTAPHPLGEVWTAVCWDIYWAFVDLYGYDSDWSNTQSGNSRAMFLTMDGMKFAPCGPGFLDMRDAILAADDDEHSCMLWEIFANRGLGYFADQGSPASRDDGTEDFEPLPTCIKELKIRKSIEGFVVPGDSLVVRLDVANHTEELAAGVVVTDLIPEGLTLVPNSANFDAVVNGDMISFDLGDYPSLSQDTITYILASDPDNFSTSTFKNEVETSAEAGAWTREIIDGTNFFMVNSLDAYSGQQSWFVRQIDGDTEQRLSYQNIEVEGDFPVLRIFHRMNTNDGTRDGGFMEISTDGGVIWRNVTDQMIRNSYRNILTYTTFAIPNLNGFAGETDEFIGTYIDLSQYAGQTIDFRCRFGSSDAQDAGTGTFAPDNGWFIDDLELLDLKFYDTQACINATEGSACTQEFRTLIDTRSLEVGVEDLAAEGVSVDIYPNPASDQFRLTINSEKAFDAELSVWTIDGQQVSSQVLSINESTNEVNVNSSTFAPGFYLVQLQSGDKVLTRKIVIE